MSDLFSKNENDFIGAYGNGLSKSSEYSAVRGKVDEILRENSCIVVGAPSKDASVFIDPLNNPLNKKYKAVLGEITLKKDGSTTTSSVESREISAESEYTARILVELSAQKQVAKKIVPVTLTFKKDGNNKDGNNEDGNNEYNLIDESKFDPSSTEGAADTVTEGTSTEGATDTVTEGTSTECVMPDGTGDAATESKNKQNEDIKRQIRGIKEYLDSPGGKKAILTFLQDKEEFTKAVTEVAGKEKYEIYVNIKPQTLFIWNKPTYDFECTVQGCEAYLRIDTNEITADMIQKNNVDILFFNDGEKQILEVVEKPVNGETVEATGGKYVLGDALKIVSTTQNKVSTTQNKLALYTDNAETFREIFNNNGKDVLNNGKDVLAVKMADSEEYHLASEIEYSVFNGKRVKPLLPFDGNAEDIPAVHKYVCCICHEAFYSNVDLGKSDNKTAYLPAGQTDTGEAWCNKCFENYQNQYVERKKCYGIKYKEAKNTADEEIDKKRGELKEAKSKEETARNARLSFSGDSVKVARAKLLEGLKRSLPRGIIKNFSAVKNVKIQFSEKESCLEIYCGKFKYSYAVLGLPEYTEGNTTTGGDGGIADKDTGDGERIESGYVRPEYIADYLAIEEVDWKKCKYVFLKREKIKSDNKNVSMDITRSASDDVSEDIGSELSKENADAEVISVIDPAATAPVVKKKDTPIIN